MHVTVFLGTISESPGDKSVKKCQKKNDTGDSEMVPTST